MKKPLYAVIVVCAIVATITLLLSERPGCPACEKVKMDNLEEAENALKLRLMLDKTKVGAPEILPQQPPAPVEEKMSKNQEALNKLRSSGFVDSLVDKDIDAMTDEEIFVTIHSHLDNINTICRRKIRMGKVADGGWEICDDIDVRPEQPCTIYSFGINYDFSFDDDSSRLYGCHVYSFDPSMKRAKTYNRSSLVHFYKDGLSGKNEFMKNRNWTVHTYSDVRRMLGHQNTLIDVIKMDIEGSEWPSLLHMIDKNQFTGVRQFLVEYHFSTEMPRNLLVSRLKILQAIDKEGFKRFLVSKNKSCQFKSKPFPVGRTNCYEVHYIRR